MAAKPRVRFTRSTCASAYDAAGQVWGIIDPATGTEIGQCWRREHGQPTYWGAWAYKIKGQRTQWSDSRKRAGLEALSDWLRKFDEALS